MPRQTSLRQTATLDSVPAPLEPTPLEALSRLSRSLSNRPRDAADLAVVASAYVEAVDNLGRIDHVTLLPNRSRFLEVLEQDAARPPRALVLLTLADAKHSNEILRALGHAYADEFVRNGAARLHEITGAALYHVSVLSFAFVVEDMPQAESLAAEIVRAFGQPILCQGLAIPTRIGLGILDYDPAAQQPADALRACLAAAQDSRSSACGWALYDRRSDEAHRRAFRLLHDLDRALQCDGQLHLTFQPRIDLRSGQCRGAEALLRWTHPQLGPISPGEFIPLAETTALIDPLTDWVLAQSLEQAATWRRQGLELCVSVNVSPRNLSQASFVERLGARLSEHDTAPHQIELEFTEGALAAHDEPVSARLRAIRDMGIDIAIDDFGTGYSNMSYLARLPARVLKIDRSFVMSLPGDNRQRNLVRSIIGMAHELDYRVVAEGIETGGVYDLLADWGCDEGQGYFMSRPLDPATFQTWWATAGRA